jgi:RimJ/RimL family protein N-acetyltransferase
MNLVETARLQLRMFGPDDLKNLTSLFLDPGVNRYVGNGEPGTREDAERALKSIADHWQKHGFGRWAVVDKNSKSFLGIGGLRSLFGTPEVVYHFLPAYWGKGLATELAHASLRYGFEEHAFDQILAIAKPQNLASIHVMEKVGMRYDKHTAYYDIDVIQYSILREEFKPCSSLYILHQ